MGGWHARRGWFDQALHRNRYFLAEEGWLAALERLLDPANPSITLQTLERAANALGRRLQITLA